MQAYFLRYPNPQSSHVVSVDVLDRRIEQRPSQGTADMPRFVLCTSRLILKRGSLPRWAPKGIIRKPESWVLEDTEVDLDEAATPDSGKSPRTMTIWTRNVDHTSVLSVTEGLRFVERAPADAQAEQKGGTTESHVRADVRSGISFSVLRKRIEKFGLNRFIAHKDTVRVLQRCFSTNRQSSEGLIWTMTHLSAIIGTGTAPVPLLEPTHPSKKERLLHMLRPPFLDGNPPTLLQRLRQHWRRWRGKSDGTQASAPETHMSTHS